MNTIYKSKAELRKETELALKKFLKSGGAIQEVKSRKTPSPKMSSKSSKGFVVGTSGFANGYPKRTLGGF